MDSVTVIGGRTYSNVVIRIDQLTVLGLGSSTTPNDTQVSAICKTENFTIDRFNAIQVGMTLDQVRQIIGCEPSLASTTTVGSLNIMHWRSSNLIISMTFTFWKST